MLEIAFFIISPLIALILLFWFKTNLVVVYGKMFRLNKFLAINKYEASLQKNPNLTYQLFIATNFDGFFYRLISCTVCLATWLSIIFTSIICIKFKNYNILYLIPFNTITGLSEYLIIKKILW